jgi:carboxyl-terminal processing protease
MVGALDRRSVRVDADEVRILQSSARMAGIGVALEIQDEMPSVVSVVGGGPAEHAGLKRSDLLTHIDGVPTHGLPITQVFGRLRGAAGSPVAITIERPGAAQVIQIQPARAFIKLRSVDAHLLPSGYGHIRIRYFGPKTLDLLGHALRSMEENSATRLRGIVLDLRSNPGGELSSCVGTASAFLPENLLVVETEGRTNDSKLRLVSSPSHYVPKGSVDPLANLPPRMKTLPIAVLVNNDTASGSEIVAAALQDYKRALIIGYRTNGSGAITNLFPLRNNDVLKLNIGLYNRPNGDITADIGVIPDFTLPSTIRETTTSNDFQLDETVKILSETLSR